LDGYLESQGEMGAEMAAVMGNKSMEVMVFGV
jgi:hypothetical protein